MSTQIQQLDSLNVSLRKAYAFVVQYVYTTDEGQQSLYDDTIGEIYTKIEIDLSLLESTIVPSLPPNKAKQQVQFSVYKLKERYRDVRAMYRWKKVDEKSKYLESQYLRSFDEAELRILNGDKRDDGNLTKATLSQDADPFISSATRRTNAYSSIDDDQLEELSAQERLLQQNNMLTDKLQNVNNLMKSTLLAGEINLNELEISTSTLSSLADSYAFFGSVLNKTNTLVKSINKASKSERQMIYRSLYFFISVCCWILWRRIFKRPVLLLLWLMMSPIKLLFWSTSYGKSQPLNATSIFSSTLLTLAATISTTIPDGTTSITTASTIAFTKIEEYLSKDEL